MEENPVKTEYAEDEINLLDYLIVLVKRKKLIAYTTLGIMVLTAIYSLTLPSIYRAETKIMPPQQSSQGSMSQLLGQLGGGAGTIGLSTGVLKTPNDLYIAFLKTNSLLDRIIDRLDLMKLYKTKSREQARGALSGALDAKDDRKSGIINIAVTDKDPKMAARYANTFVEELKAFNKGLAIGEASQRRLFYEEQLGDEKKTLETAEEDLKVFQEKTGVLQIEQQAFVAITNIASVKAQIAAKEIELRVLRTYSTSNNPDVKKVEEAIKAMKDGVNKLQIKNKIEYEPVMPSQEAPGVALEYLRKFRNVKFHTALYEFMLKQYEAARIDEGKDATIIQVIDKAEPPERRFKPQRTKMVLIAGVVGFFLSILSVFFMEYVEKSSSNPENKERIDEIKKHFSFGLLPKLEDMITKLMKGIKTNKN